MTSSTATKWYNRSGLVIVLSPTLFPVGLYALWKNQWLKTGAKIGLTVVSPFTTLVLILGGITAVTMLFFKTDMRMLDAQRKYDNKDYPGAIAEYNAALKDDPTNAILYAERGRTYYKINNHQKAIADYSMAFAFDSTDAKVLYNRALAKEAIDDYRGAHSDYTAALRIDPSDAKSYAGRGWATFMIDTYDVTAITDLDKAIQINPSDADFYNERGIVKLWWKQYVKATTDFNQAIQINSLPKAYFNRGKARLALGQVKGACEDFSTATNLGVKDAVRYQRQNCQ